MASFGNDYVRDNWIVGKLDTLLSNNWSNEARYMYGRDFEFEFNQTPTSYEQNNLVKTPSGYLNPLGLPANVYLSGFFQFGTPQFLNRAALPDERRWQLADTVVWVAWQPYHQVRRGLHPHRRSHLQPLQPVRRIQLQRQHAARQLHFRSLPVAEPVAGKTAENYTSFNQGVGAAGLDFNYRRLRALCRRTSGK